MNFKTFCEQFQVQDGDYDGFQSGNEFSTADGKVVLKTKNGVRGRNIKCNVSVNDGKIVKHSFGDFIING